MTVDMLNGLDEAVKKRREGVLERGLRGLRGFE